MLINQEHFRTIWVESDGEHAHNIVAIIDQTQLPHAFVVAKITSLAQMITAIKTMQVRGAPLIGAAAAYGLALSAQLSATDDALSQAAQSLIDSRPTAVNLQWAVTRMLDVLLKVQVAKRHDLAWQTAALICDEDVAMNRAIGQHGLAVIQKAYDEKMLLNTALETKVHTTTQNHAKYGHFINILTHCNAGWLATVDGGTALAPIYAAHDAGIPVHVWVDETRPRNQGASLTAWELAGHGVPHTVISDNAGGHLMQHGQVDMVMVGADRVTALGDVCNKIGTYLKALAAFDNVNHGQRIPFYAVVPSPTIDWAKQHGVEEIDIEMRHADELRLMRGRTADGTIAEIDILPAHTHVSNPAFDVTPARLVTGILTEHGIFTPQSLTKLHHLLTR